MRSPDNLEQYSDLFSDAKFWKKVRSVAKRAGIKVIYAALELYYAMQDASMTKKDRLVILGALGYFILPIDLIPDFIPVAGFTDDLAALALALLKVAKCITPDVKARAQAKLHQWFGNYEQNEIVIDKDDYQVYDTPDEQ